CLARRASCPTGTRDNTGSSGELRQTRVDLTDVKIDGSTDLAIRSYKQFLDETPEGGMTPEALRRLADLKGQRESGSLEGVTRSRERAARRDARSEPAAAASAPVIAAASSPVVAAAAPEL